MTMDTMCCGPTGSIEAGQESNLHGDFDRLGFKADSIDATACPAYLCRCKGRTPNCQGGKCRNRTGGAFGRSRAGGFS